MGFRRAPREHGSSLRARSGPLLTGHSPRQKSWSPDSGYGSAPPCRRQLSGSSVVPIPCPARRARSRFDRYSSSRISPPHLSRNSVTKSLRSWQRRQACRSKSDKGPNASKQEKNMKYICLGYIEENKWETMSESEREAMLDECFNYDDLLRKNGHFAGGQALQSPRNATTLRWQGGKVLITDGPYAETKEQLGGILVLEATDLNHAIRLMSKHPGVKAGPFEIRPAADLSEMIRGSEERRAKKPGQSS